MSELPDCPRCDAAGTLEPVQTTTQVVVICLCTCCGKTVVVKDGRALLDARDTQGNMLRD